MIGLNQAHKETKHALLTHQKVFLNFPFLTHLSNYKSSTQRQGNTKIKEISCKRSRFLVLFYFLIIKYGVFQAKLLGLSKKVDECVLEPPKQHGCSSCFGESAQHRFQAPAVSFRS